MRVDYKDHLTSTEEVTVNSCHTRDFNTNTTRSLHFSTLYDYCVLKHMESVDVSNVYEEHLQDPPQEEDASSSEEVDVEPTAAEQGTS